MLRLLSLSSAYPDENRPGMGNFVERQLRGLAERPGVEVEVVAPVGLPPFPLSLRPRYRLERTLPRAETIGGLRVHRPRFTILPYCGAGRADAMARALLPAMDEIRRRFAFDLILAEFFWPDGPAAMRLARRLGLPYAIKARGGDFERSAMHRSTRQLVLEAGTGAARLLAVSNTLRSAMVAAGLPADRIAVHHTGVDRAQFRLRDRAAAKTALKVHGPLLLNVGNLLPRKRQLLAIETLARIEGATLMIVGGGPDRKLLEARVRRLGLEHRVRMMGRVPQALLPFFYAAADVTLHTATMEGLANVWVESLACGTPVVATEAGGAREVIDRPEAGRVVASDPAAIAGAVGELLALAPVPAAVAASAAGYSWERNAAELEAHMRAAVAGAPLSPA
ncbi:MAG TPA: glycosyltransferase [Allosphingosinicella sp.]